MNPAAAQHADLLRRIGDGAKPIETIDGLAAEVQRDPSNLRKTIKALESDGLIVRSEEGRPLDLSAAGRRTILGIDVADGVAVLESGGAEPRVSHESLRPNPLNPRHIFDGRELAGLADTIEEAGDVLQAIIVSPPEEDGARIILAGERRWRATCLLAEQGRLPEALVAGLPYRERAFSPVQALFIGIVENKQREPLTPWEDAQALLALHVETGWSAREIAKRTGRSPEGTETGVRDVQEKIKVAREAKPEDVAKHQGGEITWEELRDTVKIAKAPAAGGYYPPKFAVNDAQAVAISELAHKLANRPCQTSVGTYAEIAAGAYADPNFIGLKDAGWLAKFSEGKRNYLRLATAAREWLVSHRRQIGDVSRGYATPWLNLPGDVPEPALLPVEEPAGERLAGGKELVLIELAHLVAGESGFEDGGQRIAPVGKYWLDARASDLQAQGLIFFAHKGAAGPHVGLTTGGRSYLADLQVDPAQADHMEAAYARGGQAAWPMARGYVTEWLNHVPSEPATLEPIAEDESEAPDLLTDNQGRADADEDVDTLTADVEAFLAEAGQLGPFAAKRFAELLARCEGVTPLHAGGDAQIENAKGEVFGIVDYDNDLPDWMARNGARLIAHAVNHYVGAEVMGDPPKAWADPAPEGETLLERVTRAGRAAMGLMIDHYDALKVNPLTADIYRQLGEAMNAAELQARADRAEASA
jgi:ParB/RepB/Spo0J family partition protein